VAQNAGWDTHRVDDELRAFLEHHVQTFNAAVETGDFAPLVDLFALDAELAFEGVPVGPFYGREAIAAAYDAQPPTDGMTILDTRVEDDGTVVEGFSWSADHGVRSGEMRLVVEDGRIRRLAVAFGVAA
jgi:steroid Delta-isomerase